MSNTLRRLLEAVGLQRRSRDVTPELDAYLTSPEHQPEQPAEAPSIEPEKGMKIVPSPEREDVT